MTVKTPQVPICVYDDAEFQKAVSRYTDQIADSQLKIGELIYYYIQAHGNKYGDNTFGHLVELTGVPDSSLRNYHNLFKLHAEYKIPTLETLPLKVRYEIAQLLDHPDATTLVPAMVEKVTKSNMTAAHVKGEVDGIWEIWRELEAEKKHLAEKKDAKDKLIEKATDTRPRFTHHHLGSIENAAEAFKTLARNDVIKEAKIPDAMIEAKVISLTDGIIRFLEKRVEGKEALNLQSIIELAYERFGKMCKVIRKDNTRDPKRPKSVKKGDRP